MEDSLVVPRNPPVSHFSTGGRRFPLRALVDSFHVVKEKTGVFVPILMRRVAKAGLKALANPDDARLQEDAERLSDEFENLLLEQTPLFIWAMVEVSNGEQKPDLAWFEKNMEYCELPAAYDAITLAIRGNLGNGTGEALATAATTENPSTSPTSGESTSSS